MFNVPNKYNSLMCFKKVNFPPSTNNIYCDVLICIFFATQPVDTGVTWECRYQNMGKVGTLLLKK